MKNIAKEFLRRGIAAWGLGPVILAVVYLVLQHQGLVQTLTVSEVCLGILSLSVLAFIVGGMNIIYQIEQLPLMVAILIHGGILYICYLATYLLNGWLEHGVSQILVFSGFFALGYLIIWAVIYSVTRHNTGKINTVLKKQQHAAK